jgi:hypothetical protein
MSSKPQQRTDKTSEFPPTVPLSPPGVSDASKFPFSFHMALFNGLLTAGASAATSD